MAKSLKQTERQVKEFWKAQAEEFGETEYATNPDAHYRAYEIARILESLKTSGTVLDIGCGNGHSTIQFAQKRPRLKIIGVDYSPEMIERANAALKRHRGLDKRVSFRVADVLALSAQKDLVGKCDQVISERCVINLLTWDKQRAAILELKKMLKGSGEVLLCENTQEGLDRLNGLRGRLGLAPIRVRWHNRYLRERELLPFLNKAFTVKDARNIGSLYYIISRVVYAKLADLDNKQPEYGHPINAIARELPPIGDFSPNYIFRLGRK